MNPSDLTDAELKAMAEITPDDVADAVAFWCDHAPEEARELIDAGFPDEDKDGKA